MTTPDYYMRCGHECRELSANYPHPLASAIEYVWRHKGKNGVEDLYKAEDWLDYFLHHENEFDQWAPVDVRQRQNSILNDLFNECKDKEEYLESRFWLSIICYRTDEALMFLRKMIEQEQSEE